MAFELYRDTNGAYSERSICMTGFDFIDQFAFTSESATRHTSVVQQKAYSEIPIAE